MDGPMDLGENLGEEPEEEDRPSLLESMQERYDPRGGSWLSPSGIQRLASGQPPKDIFRNSEDPFRFAWQLLKNTPTQEDDVGLTPEFMQELLEAVQGNVWADIAPPEEGANIPSTEDENDPLTAPTNPRPNSPTPVGQEEMVREGGDDLDARLAQIAAELARRDEDKPGVTPRSAGDNPMFRHLRPELEQMQADTEAEIGRRDENREARRAVRRGV
jgi:hypothetical protein